MEFGFDKFEQFFPQYLTSEQKTRLKDGLSQFNPTNAGDISYVDFYKNWNDSYFMQSDLVKEIRVGVWNESTLQYEKGYINAIIISNTCDISLDNIRKINTKQCVFAPILEVEEQVKIFKEQSLEEAKIETFLRDLKRQTITNMIYLPELYNSKNEYIVLLDKMFWFPTEELHSYIPEIKVNRLSSLSYFGYYLFIFKLSYHLARLPEVCDRQVVI